MKKEICQEPFVLSDINSRGKERPWACYKELSSYLAIAYDEVDVKKADRLRGCAEWLEFFPDERSGRMKLHKANFCRVRLCPVCQWRRSLKTFAQMRKVMSAIHSEYAFIHLTLTVSNCDRDELSLTLDTMFYAFNKLTKYSKFSRAVKGYYRGMEVTHNLKSDTYHPHFHCVLAVNRSYFTSRDYIKQAELLSMWRRAMGDSSIKIVHVERLYGSTEKAVAEVAKYTCKPSDYIVFDDWDLTVDTVRVLDKALHKRRFIGLGGVIKEAHKRLNLDDMEDGDLLHTGLSEEDLTAEEKGLITFVWSTGYRQYIKDS